jgi:hypothetical protein
MVQSGPLKISRTIFAQRPQDPPGTARMRVFAYSVALHHMVNVRTGKSPAILARTLDFWTRKYAKMRK